MKARPFLTCSLLMGCTSLAVAQTKPTAPSPGQQILQASAATYESLREFKGGAAVISQSRIDGELYMTNTDAKFDFVRGSRFNITGHDTEHFPFNIKSTPQKTIQTWQYGSKPKTEAAENIEMAVAGMTGVAMGAPTTIPALLLDSNWGFPFSPRGDATLKGREVFGGRECYIITEQRDSSSTSTFWIDAQTLLLRGIREERSAPQRGVGSKGAFDSEVDVFSIEHTLPTESQLAAAAKPLLAKIDFQVSFGKFNSIPYSDMSALYDANGVR